MRIFNAITMLIAGTILNSAVTSALLSIVAASLLYLMGYNPEYHVLFAMGTGLVFLTKVEVLYNAISMTITMYKMVSMMKKINETIDKI